MEKKKDRNTNTCYKYWALRGMLIFIILILERAISKTNLHTHTSLSSCNFSINSSLTRVESRFSQISVTLKNFMLNLSLLLTDLKYRFSANSFSHDLWISTCGILAVGAKLPGSRLKPVSLPVFLSAKSPLVKLKPTSSRWDCTNWIQCVTYRERFAWTSKGRKVLRCCLREDRLKKRKENLGSGVGL